MLVFLYILLGVINLENVYGSHFRGGIFMVRPVGHPDDPDYGDEVSQVIQPTESVNKCIIYNNNSLYSLIESCGLTD